MANWRNASGVRRRRRRWHGSSAPGSLSTGGSYSVAGMLSLARSKPTSNVAAARIGSWPIARLPTR
jgi:hypothetical protein